MTPEQKAAIAAAKAQADGVQPKPEIKVNAEEETAEPIQGAENAEATIETDLSQPDYEALWKEEKERADSAAKAAADIAFKARQARRGKNEEDEEDIDDGDDDKPLTRSEFNIRMERERGSIQKSALEAAALTIARANTSSEAEAQATILFYKTRVVPTDNLEDDVLGAIAMVNRKRTVGRTVELARALKSKETALHGTATVFRDTAPASEPKITAQDAQAIKQAGMVWDGKMRVYKKPLGNGTKHLFFDPKSKRRWTA